MHLVCFKEKSCTLLSTATTYDATDTDTTMTSVVLPAVPYDTGVPAPLADDEHADKRHVRTCLPFSNVNLTFAAVSVSFTFFLTGLTMLLMSINSQQEQSIDVRTANPVFANKSSAAVQQATFAAWLTAVGLKVGSVEVNGPQLKALSWLVMMDPSQLDPLAESRQRLQQRYALTVFYYQFSGEYWDLPVGAGWPQQLTSTDNDANSVHECFWPMVECDTTETVVGLISTANQNGIRLRGYLPVELGLLTSMQTLQLVDKTLQGTLPTELYRQWTDLRVLDLALNQIVELSSDVQFWGDSLEILNVAGNKLYGPLPTELYQLSRLTELRVDENIFAEGPLLDNLVDSWPAMRVFVVTGTGVSGGLTSTIGALTNLKRLEAYRSPVKTSIPTEIALCTSLLEFALGDSTGNSDGVKGTIPTEIGRLTNLQKFAAADGDLSGSIPSEFGLCTDLEILSLNNNRRLSGTLPKEFGELTMLEVLVVTASSLSGTIPSVLGRCTNLSLVELFDTDLTGKIPDSLCDLLGAGTLGKLTVDCRVDSFTGLSPMECSCGCTCG